MTAIAIQEGKEGKGAAAAIVLAIVVNKIFVI
jgi:hypothetical protein